MLGLDSRSPLDHGALKPLYSVVGTHESVLSWHELTAHRHANSVFRDAVLGAIQLPVPENLSDGFREFVRFYLNFDEQESPVAVPENQIDKTHFTILGHLDVSSLQDETRLEELRLGDDLIHEQLVNTPFHPPARTDSPWLAAGDFL
jgi:hypothetical protein